MKNISEMPVELTTLGERGQTVIPKAIREKMPAPKGTMFAVVLVDEDTLVMKRFDKSKLVGEFKELRASIGRKFTDEDIVDEIKKARKA